MFAKKHETSTSIRQKRDLYARDFGGHNIRTRTLSGSLFERLLVQLHRIVRLGHGTIGLGGWAKRFCMNSSLPSSSPAAPADAAAGRFGRLAIAWFGLLFVVGIYLWITRTVPFVADDSFFYVVIARNIALKGEQTFSNIVQTNGFHPLWGYILAAYTYLVHAIWPDAVYDIRYAVPLSIAILVGTTIQCWRLAKALLLDPLIVTSLFIGFLLSTGVLYSEGPLLALLMMTMAGMMARDPEAPITRPITFGILAGATVLSRLDAVFFAGFVYLYYVSRYRFNTRLLVSGITCGLIVGTYVLSNIVYFGGAMPISGWMKGSFPHPFARGFESGGLRIHQAAFGGFSIVMGWLPLAIGLYTLLALRPLKRMQRVILGTLWAGAITQGVYVALFTRSHTMWPWYYVLPMAVLAISMSLLAQHWQGLHLRFGVLALVSLLVVAAQITKLDDAKSPSVEAVDYVNNRSIHGETLLVSDWPGALAFYTDNNVLAVDMLTFNRYCFERMRKSPNALKFLIDECKRLGKPIRHIIMLGNQWLVWDRETESVTYYDPRRYPILQPIGKLPTRETPQGLETVDGIEIWQGPTHKPADQASVNAAPKTSTDLGQ
jgi:hypothetical protein